MTINNKRIYLSYILDNDTPSYGNREGFSLTRKSDMSNGDHANNSVITTTVHIGTHIDMPSHFFENGQTIKDFDINHFSFDKVLFVDIQPKEYIVKEELIDRLTQIDGKDKFDLLIVRTGICFRRDTPAFGDSNYGFDPCIADFLRQEFPNIKVIGFDSISVSSFKNRILGRESHKRFLDPSSPILLLEDMDLTKVDENTTFDKVIIAPLRVAECDGLPCTVIAEIR